MYKTSMPKESTTISEELEFLVDNAEFNKKALVDYINKLETKIRHIEQYFDDLDDIDYKTIKKEVERILNE